MTPRTTPIGSLFSLKRKANKIVVFWLCAFVIVAPETLLGWRYAVGVCVGIALAALFDWRKSWR